MSNMFESYAAHVRVKLAHAFDVTNYTVGAIIKHFLHSVAAWPGLLATLGLSPRQFILQCVCVPVPCE